MDQSTVAVVIVAHDQPHHLQRLVAALDPLPVFLHVDAHTADETVAYLRAHLPERVRFLPRRYAGWARPEVVEAELDGYRAALSYTTADHIVVITGSEYPLISVAELTDRLAAERGKTFGHFFSLPSLNWKPLGGLERLLLPQRAEGRRRTITGWPRRWPPGIRPAGGAQQKIVARDHAMRIVAALDDDASLWPFFATCWVPDEVLVPTLLRSRRRTGIDWPAGYGRSCTWYIDWGRGRAPSPRWLDDSDFRHLARARANGAVFARKFRESNTALLDRIEAEIW